MRKEKERVDPESHLK